MMHPCANFLSDLTRLLMYLVHFRFRSGAILAYLIHFLIHPIHLNFQAETMIIQLILHCIRSLSSSIICCLCFLMHQTPSDTSLIRLLPHRIHFIFCSDTSRIHLARILLHLIHLMCFLINLMHFMCRLLNHFMQLPAARNQQFALKVVDLFNFFLFNFSDLDGMFPCLPMHPNGNIDRRRPNLSANLFDPLHDDDGLFVEYFFSFSSVCFGITHDCHILNKLVKNIVFLRTEIVLLSFALPPPIARYTRDHTCGSCQQSHNDALWEWEVTIWQKHQDAREERHDHAWQSAKPEMKNGVAPSQVLVLCDT
mmetsp:Transcript_4981/g.12115  ORF Transcript_4981/g.12115 Transcript_4981/m.12115 type:complete len:310 (+) Transcript_4981:259-1188(+)